MRTSAVFAVLALAAPAFAVGLDAREEFVARALEFLSERESDSESHSSKRDVPDMSNVLNNLIQQNVHQGAKRDLLSALFFGILALPDWNHPGGAHDSDLYGSHHGHCKHHKHHKHKCHKHPHKCKCHHKHPHKGIHEPHHGSTLPPAKPSHHTDGPSGSPHHDDHPASPHPDGPLGSHPPHGSGPDPTGPPSGSPEHYPHGPHVSSATPPAPSNGGATLLPPPIQHSNNFHDAFVAQHPGVEATGAAPIGIPPLSGKAVESGSKTALNPNQPGPPIPGAPGPLDPPPPPPLPPLSGRAYNDWYEARDVGDSQSLLRRVVQARAESSGSSGGSSSYPAEPPSRREFDDLARRELIDKLVDRFFDEDLD